MLNGLDGRIRLVQTPDAATSARRPLPLWARVMDFGAVALALVAGVIALSGGTSIRLLNGHLGLTSPGRFLLWAVVLIVVRHLITREQPIYGHLTERAKAWSRSAAVRTAVLVAVVTRPLMFAAGYLAVMMFGYAPGAEPFHDFSSELMNLPLRWDAGWYMGIATRGYEYSASAGAEAQQNIVFFPAFPMLVRFVARLGGNGPAAYVLGATLVSVTLFILALVYFYLLAREELDADQAATAVWLLALFPFSVFYGAIYTESLYLLGALGAFYHFRRREFVRAACWGLLVGLTRPNGFFLCAPLGILLLSQLRDRRAWLAAAAPAAGVFLYCLFIWQLAGNPIAWAMGHAAWGRHYGGLSRLVIERYGYISNSGLLQYISLQPYDLLNGTAVVLILASVWPVARRFGVAFAVFVLINILPPLAAGGLMSAGRFSSVLFPAFLWLAAVVPARHRAGWIAAFAGLQTFNAALFYTWRPLY
jgi:hypothetical protein